MRIKQVVRHANVRAVGVSWCRNSRRSTLELSLIWRTIRWIWLREARPIVQRWSDAHAKAQAANQIDWVEETGE